ncbi:MAG: hypothetical protein QMD71_02155 [bacterium]|nr:hypothetical protein [bacterium]
MMVVNKTICPFCVLGCELGIVADATRIKVEYIKGSKPNDGRLCPRGNGAALYLDHPNRITSPIEDGKKISWTEAFKKIAKVLKRKNVPPIAITFDTNLTLEEYSLVFEFGKALGIENLASSYIEPEFYFNYLLHRVKTATLDDVSESQVFLIVGDIFSQFPIISKPILDARYKDRNNRIFVIDSVCTYTAGFADTFIQVAPGDEPIAVLEMSNIVSGKQVEVFSHQLSLFDKIGVSHSVLESVAKSLNEAQKGVVIAGTAFGRVIDPLLFSGALQYFISLLSNDKRFLPLSESVVGCGKLEFGEILEKIQGHEVKVLLNFGELFPFYYPQVYPALKKLNLLVSTATFYPDDKNIKDLPGLFLPAALNLEKFGTISTVLGNRKICPVIEPMSGTKTVESIVNSLATELSIKLTGEPQNPYKKEIEVSKILNSLNRIPPFSERKKPDKLYLIGEKPAYGFRGLFESNWKEPQEVIPQVKVNPVNAEKLRVKEKDTIILKSNTKKMGPLKVNISNRVPTGVSVIPTELPETRSIFELIVDDGICSFPPVEVTLDRLKPQINADEHR